MGSSRASTRIATRPLFGTRGVVVLVLFLIAIVAWFSLGLSPAGLIPNAGGLAVARRFFAGALHPAFDYEGETVDGADAFLATVLHAARRTVVFAAAGMSLALGLGLVLGFFGASAWWSGETARGASKTGRFLARFV